MLEFVLVLPFIWIVMALTMNFGLAYLEHQRSLVALREVAIRHAAALAGSQSADMGAKAAELTNDTLRPRQMSASFTLQMGSPSCPGRGGSGDGGLLSGVFSSVQRFAGHLSATQMYQSQATGQRPIGRLVPQLSHAGCYALDVNPWTYGETHGYGGIIGGLTGIPGL